MIYIYHTYYDISDNPPPSRAHVSLPPRLHAPPRSLLRLSHTRGVRAASLPCASLVRTSRRDLIAE